MKINLTIDLTDEECATFTRWLDANKLTLQQYMQGWITLSLAKAREGAPTEQTKAREGNVVPFKKRT